MRRIGAAGKESYQMKLSAISRALEAKDERK